MKAEKLKSRILKTENIKWSSLHFIQAENFKEWIPGSDVKLFNSLLRYSFIDPFKVWEDKGVIYCLDGKHRFMDLQHAKEQGVVVPDLLPANFISCKNKQEAAELVLVYSSAYAMVTEKGLFDFIDNYQIDMTAIAHSIDLNGIDITKLLGDISRDFATKNQELNVSDFTDDITMKFTYPKDDYIKIKGRIDEQMKKLKLSSPEELLKKLLKVE